MVEFPDTLARLRADRGRAPAAIAVLALVVLAAWCGWASFVPLTLYEVSTSARLERDAATYPIQAPVAGRVVASALRVGESVSAGDVLVELDVETDALRLRAEGELAQGIAAEIGRLRAQADAEQRARLEERGSADLASEEAHSRTTEAATEARHAETEHTRIERLFDGGLLPQSAMQKSLADVQRLRARLAALEAAARRVTQDQITRDRERDVRLAHLASQIAPLEADERASRANLDRLRYEVARRQVRATIGGTVGEAAQIRPGAVLGEGERLGSIVPSGALRIVAQFAADHVLGRLRPGQSASLRLAAYPWAEFGTVDARVSKVASEVRDGSVRVELTLAQGSRFTGTLDHGMPGSVEVAVERITPLALVLRIAGQRLSEPR